MEAPLKGDRVSVVEEGVEDAVIEGGIADHIVLVLDGGLVGGGGCRAGIAVAESLEQVAWVHGGSGRITEARDGQSDGGGADAGSHGEASSGSRAPTNRVGVRAARSPQASCSATRPTRAPARVLPRPSRTATPSISVYSRIWKGASTVRPNARHLTRFSCYSNTTDPVTASRQERQIVQS